jgi:hypothetical protein
LELRNIEEEWHRNKESTEPREKHSKTLISDKTGRNFGVNDSINVRKELRKER